MITSETFKQYLDFAWNAYQEHNVSDQEYRQGGSIPYVTHPLGAALLHIADTNIPYEERELGCKILILHDVLEDTSLALPDWVEDEVRRGVEEMTYTGPKSLEKKMERVRSKNDFVKLLMLYDAFWSLYERHVGGSEERRAMWKNGVLDLADDVERHYWNIRIVHIARTVAHNTEW